MDSTRPRPATPARRSRRSDGSDDTDAGAKGASGGDAEAPADTPPPATTRRRRATDRATRQGTKPAFGRKRYALVMHGSRADQPEIRRMVQWVREKGHTVEPHVTWESGDATAFARAAAASGVDVVIAAGGDGTVNEVVNGLSGYDVPLGIIPVGTANDFARQVGIPLDVDHAMDVILRSKPRAVDTIDLNGRLFLNVSTGGVGAEATAETGAGAKESLGMLAYAITGVKKLAGLNAKRATFRGPDLDIETRFLLFAVGNARLTGGGSALTPKASITDGLLDLCIVEALPRAEFARLVLRLKRGEHLDHDAVHYHQLPAVTIESSSLMSVNVDGEPSNARSLHYAVRPASLQLHLAALPGGA